MAQDRKKSAAESAEAQRQESFAEAQVRVAARVVGWESLGLRPEDYDFRSWAKEVPGSADDGHIGLRLGTHYEYAREGRKMRGLLLLMAQTEGTNRKGQRWRKFYEPSFEELTEDAARATVVDELIDALIILAKPLAANQPFACVWKEQRTLVENAIKAARVKHQARVRLGITKLWRLQRAAPVELALQNEVLVATHFETVHAWSPAKNDKERQLEKIGHRTARRQVIEGKEVLLLRVDWGNYRDSQLQESFGELVKRLRGTKRGGGEVPKEPKSGSGGTADLAVWRGRLDNLSLLRLRHGLKPANALHTFEEISLNRRKSDSFLDARNARKKAKAAIDLYGKLFCWEARLEHKGTLRSRVARSVPGKNTHKSSGSA